MVPPAHQSAAPIPLLRTAKQPCLSMPARSRKAVNLPHSMPSAVAGPSAPPHTTLSQRFRRAIQQVDLASAQRIAARAFELQFLSDPANYDVHVQSIGQSGPRPPKAALRAVQAQRPSSARPFDIRNVDPLPERIGLTKSHHHRKYTLAIYDEPLDYHTVNADPSLMIAIRSNADVELVRWLIEMGHEYNAPSLDADGHTILHLATLYDRSDIIYAYSTYTTSHVASTLADLIDAETLHDCRTALHLACIRGFDDVARQLLDLGADLDLQDRAGNTALHFASAWGHLSLVQLLIERGCSLAVQNTEGSTASDYAYSHSVKEALETLGRVRYESRKKIRRVPVAAVMHAAPRNAASAHVASPQADESSASDRSLRSRPFPSFLSRNGSHSGAHRTSTATPMHTSFAETGADQTPELYADWDPEKTFAQPGQDLFPSNRGAFSSPPVQRVASPAYQSTQGRASIDLYSEVLNQSPRAPASRSMAAAPIISHEYTLSPQPRSLAQSPPTMLPPTANGMLPDSASGTDIKRSLSPNLGPAIRRTPSPGNVGASADKVRMQDAAAMSLFRSASPQPSLVPGRIDTPPTGYMIRSECPLSLTTNRAGKIRVKSPPPLEATGTRSMYGSTMTSDGATSSDKVSVAAAADRSSEGPPLLAPIATLPRRAEADDTTKSPDSSIDARSSTDVYDASQHFMADTRRDSSASTPRPAEDRETF